MSVINYTCDCCGKEFTDFDENYYRCFNCGKMWCSYECAVKDGYETKGKGLRQTYSCNYCKKSMTNEIDDMIISIDKAFKNGNINSEYGYGIDLHHEDYSRKERSRFKKGLINKGYKVSEKLYKCKYFKCTMYKIDKGDDNNEEIN